MAEGDWAFAVEAPGVRAARGEMVGDAFDRCEVGGLSVETKLSCYSAHFLTGSPLGMSGWRDKGAQGGDSSI
ncbi:hypothetical protein D3C72_2303150 [compost metagenome]